MEQTAPLDLSMEKISEEQKESWRSLINEEDNEQAGPSSLSVEGSSDEQKLQSDNQKKELLKLFTIMYAVRKPLKCGKCNKTFSDLRDLGAHVKAAIGERKTNYSKCRKNYTYSTSVREDLRPRPYSTERRSNCSECRRKFSYPVYVRKLTQARTKGPYN